jgi:hypothetical protein
MRRISFQCMVSYVTSRRNTVHDISPEALGANKYSEAKSENGQRTISRCLSGTSNAVNKASQGLICCKANASYARAVFNY